MSRREILFTQKLQRCVAVNIIALSLAAVNSFADCDKSLVENDANPETLMVTVEQCGGSESITDLLEVEEVPYATSILPDSRLNRPLNDEGCMPAGRSRLKLGEIK
tara:strand:+ start:18129 stop:18446 length:318 start_codon:yes stop_codon:yes gene_type:complete